MPCRASPLLTCLRQYVAMTCAEWTTSLAFDACWIADEYGQCTSANGAINLKPFWCVPDLSKFKEIWLISIAHCFESLVKRSMKFSVIVNTFKDYSSVTSTQFDSLVWLWIIVACSQNRWFSETIGKRVSRIDHRIHICTFDYWGYFEIQSNARYVPTIGIWISFHSNCLRIAEF